MNLHEFKDKKFAVKFDNELVLTEIAIDVTDDDLTITGNNDDITLTMWTVRDLTSIVLSDMSNKNYEIEIFISYDNSCRYALFYYIDIARRSDDETIGGWTIKLKPNIFYNYIMKYLGNQTRDNFMILLTCIYNISKNLRVSVANISDNIDNLVGNIH